MDFGAEPPALPRVRCAVVVSNSMLGQDTCKAIGFFTVRCSLVHPSTVTNPDCPETTPPAGTGSKNATPLARVTPINSESGLTATHDSTSGTYSPDSVLSWVARTAPISVNPRIVSSAIMPG